MWYKCGGWRYQVFKNGLVFVIVAFFLLTCCESERTRQFVFINSSDVPRHVTFERKTDSGDYEEHYSLFKEVPPRTTAYASMAEGTFRIHVFIDTDNGMELQFTVEPYEVRYSDNPNIYLNYTWLDLTGNNRYALVDLSSLYTGNEIQNNLRESLGYTGGNFIRDLYEEGKPFTVSLDGQLEIIPPYKTPPDEISLGTQIFCLVPFSTTLRTKEEITAAIVKGLKTYYDLK